MARLFPWAALGLVSLFGATGCEKPPPPKAALAQPLCWRYEPLTAAIASVTIDCQGTIGPGSFTVDSKGYLTPTFKSCIPGATKAKSATAPAPAVAPVTASPAPAAPVAAGAAAPGAAAAPAVAIAKAAPAPAAQAVVPAASTDAAQAEADYALLTQLLSFQQIPDLPGVSECVGGRWTDWSELFKQTKIKTCPTWVKTEVIGAPVLVPDSQTQAKKNLTAQQSARMEPRLPVAPGACNELKTPAERRKCTLDAVHDQLQKDPQLYRNQKLAQMVVPPKTSATYTVAIDANEPCDDPAVCAAQCAAAFPGFVLAASGNRVDGDATYWLSADPPHTYDGYTHPMAQFQGPPGDVYGHFNRIGEKCWRWDDFDGLYVETLRDAQIPGVPLSHCGGF